MIERALSRGRRVRLYLEPPSVSAFPVFHFEVCVVPRVRARWPRERRALAVEALVPYGGGFGYGLLGFTAAESTESECVRVGASTGEGGVFDDALAAKIDTVRWGLPLEYQGAVRAAVLEGLRRVEMPRGVVVDLAWSAHGVVGSSPTVFARLASVLIASFELEDPEAVLELIERSI